MVTGAAGYVAQRMWKELSDRWDLVGIDVRDTRRDGARVPGIIVADLTRPDRNEYRQHFKGADAVIHCGFVSAPRLDATTWQNNSDAKFQAEHAIEFRVAGGQEQDGHRQSSTDLFAHVKSAAVRKADVENDERKRLHRQRGQSRASGGTPLRREPLGLQSID